MGHSFLFSLTSFDRHELASLALMTGAVLFAVLATVLLLRTRNRAASTIAAAQAEIDGLQTDCERLRALMLVEPQVVAIWHADGQSEVIGEIGDLVPDAPNRLARRSLLDSADDGAPERLALTSWLTEGDADRLDQALQELRAAGKGFTLTLTSAAGTHIEADGRAVGDEVVLRLRDLSRTERNLAELATAHRELQSETEALRILVDRLPAPVWVRDAAGRLVFVNEAYARAVDATDSVVAVSQGAELLNRTERDALLGARVSGAVGTRRMPAIVAGDRRMLDVLDITTGQGSAGIGIDATEAETMRADISRMVDAHRRTFDQLATAVAIFDAGQKLTFYNAAYRALWDLEPAFLDSAPSDSAVLDRLRAARKLPEQQDFRAWKKTLHEAYRAHESKEHEWHLLDGRTLRVVTTPNPDGGVTYVFGDMTERLDLERRFDALIRVQRETLDHLRESVAVFGSDGRLRLYNPALVEQWRLPEEELRARPHVESVIAWCRPLHRNEDTWREVRAVITGLESRRPLTKRIERTDGSVLDCATMPLPDGGTLVTCHDVTDSVNVERALVDRNDALVAADRLKIDFVRHVSYEVRSPLTNIVGFAHFLGDPSTGALNERQREYLDYITYSTNALLALINDILDLATVNAGAMQLDLATVDIRGAMEAAAEGVRDRLIKDDITLDIVSPPNIGTMVADEKRLRQILFNLLSNAVGFSPVGATVTLRAQRQNDTVVFEVTDLGPGIPDGMKDKVFEMFATQTSGSRHRGAGLGLSMVRSFVELHGGRVEIVGNAPHGTTVTCVFPATPGTSRA
jgi:signal transduction histidine kinase